MAKRDRLVLVDGSAVFHRGYHALPPLSNKEGIPTNATLGYATILLRVLSDLKPKYEADDIIGTLGRQAEQQGLETIIVTGDKDEFQLIDENTRVYTMRRGFTDTVIYDLEAMQERYGLTPRQFIDLKALMGDSSDNIPGVEGVGEKTAMNLLEQYGSLDGVYEHAEEIAGKLGERVRASKDIAYLSKELSTIVCDVPGIELDLSPAEVGKYDRQHIHELFRRLEFKSLMSKLPPELQPSAVPTLFDQGVAPDDSKPERKHLAEVDYRAVTTKQQLDKLVTDLGKQSAFAFDTETTSVDEMDAKMVGISISWKEAQAYYIPVAHQDGEQLSQKDVVAALKPIFENPDVGKIGHNAKYDYKILSRHGIVPAPITFDTMIAAFLLNPLGRSQSLDDLAYSEFGIEMIPISELIGTGRNQTTFDHAPIDTATTYAAEDADISWRLYERMAPELKKAGFDKLAAQTEWPLVEILGDMELAGIELDTKFLHTFNTQISGEIIKLEKRIHDSAGETFNIASPAQLSVILFEKLALPTAGVKKGKTGFSTAVGELERLRDAHEIVPLLMEYRELTKLKSTYVEALPLMVKADGRVHTNYSQTIVPSGRLSSNNPNLQNIPVRTPLGREIRKAFVAPKGRVLVSADYSQIELRVAAALSKDKGMIETFKKGVDLHQQTAAEMFGVTLDQVTKEQRSAAKTVNFGVLYGMSPHGLSVATGMTREEATAFIERYFEVRKTLKAYIDKIKEDAHKNEYVETLLGRRWPCAEINSNNFQIRSAAERVAVNIPIQGTATGEIMKLAMIALNKQLKDTPTKMLLQIHDQLILEVDEKDAVDVAKLLKDTMENVYDLGVPIVADTAIGKTWGEL